MQHYTFMLDNKSAQYVVIMTPIGKWGHVHVPMGSFIGSTNRVQAVMDEIFQEVIQDVECYIDDIVIFDNDWDKHIKMIDLILTRLKYQGVTVNRF
jgi:hypothetical protein